MEYKNGLTVSSRTTVNSPKCIFYFIKSSVSDSYLAQHGYTIYTFLGRAESESRRVKIKWRLTEEKVRTLHVLKSWKLTGELANFFQFRIHGQTI